jgi:hypothetical protein
MALARLYLMLALAVVTVNCGKRESGGGVRVQYQVSYADDSHGSADIAYRAPDGDDVGDSAVGGLRQTLTRSLPAAVQAARHTRWVGHTLTL